jgi:hypothetical protein
MKRVSDWTKRIEPILNAQEELKPFDIHEYSDDILDTAKYVIIEKRKSLPKNLHEKDIPKTIDQIAFSEIVSGKSTSEICRLFLSCLQLTNAGNLEIVSNNSLNKDIIPTQIDSFLKKNAKNGKNNKKQGGNKRKGIQADDMEAAEEASDETMVTPLIVKEAITENAINNDIIFRLCANQRSKDIETFRAPSVITHEHDKENMLS